VNGAYKNFDTRTLKDYGEPSSDIDAVTCLVFEEDVEKLLLLLDDEEMGLWGRDRSKSKTEEVSGKRKQCESGE
jgi:hypothetical protein